MLCVLGDVTHSPCRADRCTDVYFTEARDEVSDEGVGGSESSATSRVAANGVGSGGSESVGVGGQRVGAASLGVGGSLAGLLGREKPWGGAQAAASNQQQSDDA